MTISLSEKELYQLVFNRSISENLLKESQINAAYQKWIVHYIGATFIEKIANDDEIINGYLKPIWAWGVVYSNFHYIANNITDKGVIAMLIEGTASILGMDKLNAAKAEMLDNIFSLMKAFSDYALLEYPEDFSGLLIEPKAVEFFGNSRYNQTPY